MASGTGRSIVTQGCVGCALQPACGGIPDAEMFGCFDRCHSGATIRRLEGRGASLEGGNSKQKRHCADSECDWTCPNNPRVFAERWAEVGGLLDYSHEAYLPISGDDWPNYIPMIRSGPRRSRPLNSPFVSLSLYECLRVLKNGKGYESPGPVEFRRRLALQDDCKVILIGVAPDNQIEGFYAKYRDMNLAKVLADIDLTAVTPPNFSYFLDVPRPHSLYNRKRMLKVADEFLRFGIPVAPHFNATHSGDWNFWIDLLRSSPSLAVYCKEFQTGNRRKTNYEPTLSEMLRVQDSVGRPLHPILVAGKKSLPGLTHHPVSFTVIDSDPSLKTNNRQMLQEGKWISQPCAPGTCLTDLLEHNIREHSEMFESRLKTSKSATQSTIREQPPQPETVVLELARFASKTKPSPSE